MTPYELFRTSCSHNSSKYSESRGLYPAASSYFGGAQGHAFLRKRKSMAFCSWCHKKTPVLLRNEKDESKFPCYHLCSQPAHAACLGRYRIDTPTVITSVSPSQPTYRFGVKLGDVFEFSFRVGLSASGASLYVSSESTCSRHCFFCYHMVPVYRKVPQIVKDLGKIFPVILGKIFPVISYNPFAVHSPDRISGFACIWS